MSGLVESLRDSLIEAGKEVPEGHRGTASVRVLLRPGERERVGSLIRLTRHRHVLQRWQVVQRGQLRRSGRGDG